MAHIRYWLHWLFRDLTTRRGKHVIVEVPNTPLIIFMVSLVIGVAIYPGFWQSFFIFIAYIALVVWGVMEYRGGRSRFRKLLGICGVLAVIGAVVLGLGF